MLQAVWVLLLLSLATLGDAIRLEYAAVSSPTMAPPTAKVMTHLKGMFGPVSFNVTGLLSVADPDNCCVQLGPHEYQDKVVLIKRGGCSFVEKTNYAYAPPHTHARARALVYGVPQRVKQETRSLAKSPYSHATGTAPEQSPS
jgi:hypothetical protein